MRIPRIHQPGPLAEGAQVALDDNGLNHVVRVLRLKPGAPLVLFNGEGGEFDAVLLAADRRVATAAVGKYHPADRESPLALTLIQGVSRGERMDYTVQKAVELGVSRIVPVVTERTVVNLASERRERRLSRWQAQVVAACEQCGRDRIPEVEPVVGLDEWLARDDDGVKLLLDHRAEPLGEEAPAPLGTANLLVGPEGGLSEGERLRARAAGYRGLRLGPRVLRTETAAVVALSILQHRWGDLR